VHHLSLINTVTYASWRFSLFDVCAQYVRTTSVFVYLARVMSAPNPSLDEVTP